MRSATVAGAATLGLAALGWIVALRRMDGMDMGTMAELGSFASFLPTWIAMVAAMMLPGVVPAVRRRARTGGAVPLVVTHLALWTLVGVPVFLLYRPHGTTAAVAVIVVAALYERHARCARLRPAALREPRPDAAWRWRVGPMSATWMVVATGLVLAQTLAAARASPASPRLPFTKEQTRMTDAHHRNPRGVARRAARAARGREGADPPQRRGRPPPAGAALGPDREGLPLRHRGRPGLAGRPLRRPLAAARVPLHVRARLHRRLPVVLGDRRRLRRLASSTSRTTTSR